jgi:zinc protease
MRNNRTAGGALILWLIAAPAGAVADPALADEAGRARACFVEARNLPMFDVSVDFPAGSAYDTREKSGVAGMTQGMLKLGAGGLSEDEIARRMADSGAQFGGRVDSDRAGVTLRTLSHAEERRQALDVFARVLQRPEFPAAVLDREKKRLVEAIKRVRYQARDVVEPGFQSARLCEPSVWIARLRRGGNRRADNARRSGRILPALLHR